MNNEQITAAWALVNAATEGPWFSDDAWRVTDRRMTFDDDGARHGETPNIIIFAETQENAAFIAASRELVPQLLTALDAERAKVARLARLLDAARAVNHDSLHGNGLVGFRKNRDRLRIALDQLETPHE